jgi:hypothetical protein
MTNAVSTTDLEALITAGKADLADLLDKVNHRAHSKSDLHRVHFKQAEVQLMEQKLAERRGGVTAPTAPAAPRAPLSENEYRVLAAAAEATAPTTFRDLGAVVTAAVREAGGRSFAADSVADQLAMRGYLTGTRKPKRPDCTITDRGRAAVAACAPFYV